MELYKKLGFNQNPFSTFSAEEEKSFLRNVYIEPLFFNTLRSDLTQGSSRFILGARGIGKTALITRLKEEVELRKALGVIIDEFDEIPLKNNEKDIIKIIIQKTTTCFSLEVSRRPHLINRLNSNQKEKLSFIIQHFFKTISKREYSEYYNKSDSIKTRNIFRKIYNYLLNRPINFFISGGIEIIAETVRKSFGLPSLESGEFYKNYLPELTLENENPVQNNEIFSNYGALKNILNDLCEIIKTCEYKTTVIFFDKIDEYTMLNSNIANVSNFLERILIDTTILMNSNYSLAFSIWNVLKPELSNKGVRFDKIRPIDITWQPDDLKNILEKRINFFSDGAQRLPNIIVDNKDIESIITLSNNSPRYLFRILSYIYDMQSERNSEETHFSKEAIDSGQLEYAKKFDYYSIYTTKIGTKEDIIRNVNRLLKIGKNTIVTKDFIDVYKVSTPTALSYIQITQNYNLVRELPETNKGAKMYEVKDPVIRYLINAGVKEIQ